MLAQELYDTAPPGSLVRFSNGEPRPPERFTRKLRAWNNHNGVGRLVERSHGFVTNTFRSSATFYLHLGNFGSEGTIVLVVRRGYCVDSSLQFELVETPKPGMVRILTPIGNHEELQFLARDTTDAENWLATHRFHNARTEIVGDPDPVVLPSITGRAA